MGAAANATPKERRTTYKDVHYCGPNFTFPMQDASDVKGAAALIGKAKNRAAVTSCVIKWANENGHADALPASWTQSAKMAAGPDTSGYDDSAADEHSGAMIALFLDDATARRLALADGEAATDLHITLCYLGDAAALGALGIARATVAAEMFAGCQATLTGQVSGYGRFLNGDDGQDVFYASVDVPGLEDLQDDLSDALSGSGVSYSEEHGFTPHITLAYLARDAANPATTVPTIPLRFDRLTVCVGDQRTDIPFGGNTARYPYFSHAAGGEGHDP